MSVDWEDLVHELLKPEDEETVEGKRERMLGEERARRLVEARRRCHLTQ